MGQPPHETKRYVHKVLCRADEIPRSRCMHPRTPNASCLTHKCRTYLNISRTRYWPPTPDDSSARISKLFADFIERQGLGESTDLPYVPSRGSIYAKIGLVLDVTGSWRTEPVTKTTAAPKELELPRALLEMGMDDTNSLIWTFNIRRYTGLTASDFLSSNPNEQSEREAVGCLHKAMLTESHARSATTLRTSRHRKHSLVLPTTYRAYKLTLQHETHDIFVSRGLLASSSVVRASSIGVSPIWK